MDKSRIHSPIPSDPALDELERLSNGVIDLIEKQRLDEAEQYCLELERQFPDQIDWIERTALVREARGQTSQAIEYYRRCITFIDEHPEDFDRESRDWYKGEIDRLESSAKG